MSIRSVILASLASADRFQDSMSSDRYEPFDLSDQELVEACEAFESIFDRPARFSFHREEHAGRLRRLFARFDRFSGRSRFNAGAGLRELRHFMLAVAEQAPAREVDAIGSLAYFLPVFEEISKGRRRLWKSHQAERWERTFPRQPLRASAT